MDFTLEDLEVVVQVQDQTTGFEPVRYRHVEVKQDQIELVDLDYRSEVMGVFESINDGLLYFLESFHSVYGSCNAEVH